MLSSSVSLVRQIGPVIWFGRGDGLRTARGHALHAERSRSHSLAQSSGGSS